MDKKDAQKNIPAHAGLIIDGNRRWARERNLPAIDGHLQGYKKLKDVPSWFFKRGVNTLSIFAFSTENWKRSQEEVNYLMKLLKKAIDEEISEVSQKDYKIVISGRISELPGDLPEVCNEIMDKTKIKRGGILNICLNYGGQAEIIDAIKKMIKNKVDPEQVHEGLIKKYLYQPDLEYPDIIVRTSGEKRISGFQLWESAYSEFLFLEKYWPDFEESDVDLIMEEFSERKRRFGENSSD